MSSNWITPVLTALLGAGLLDLVSRAISWLVRRRRQTRPQVVEAQKVHEAVSQADQSIAVVARARDQLEEDNRRLREEAATERQRHAAERGDWWAERAELRAEINKCEGRLRDALSELQAVKARYGIS